MEINNVNVTTKKGVNGNKYTERVANDQLTNKDFLKLMIEELKRQDPTKPMNSREMISSQMQMSTINTNQETIKAMKALQSSFAQSSLSSAANLIGKNIENGEVGTNGVAKWFTVRSIENIDGKIHLRVQESLYMERKIKHNDKIVNYNLKGEILDEKGQKTGNVVLLESPGVPKLKDGKLQILDKDKKLIKDSGYELAGVAAPVYSDQFRNMPFSKITKVF